MEKTNESVFSISEKLRRFENLHIVFWLFKDLSWCMIWKPVGIFMILPTLSIALYLIYNTRHQRSELYHNIAVTFWIIANSYWMISEFFAIDEKVIALTFTGKDIAIVPFLAGVIVLGWYYCSQYFLNLKNR